MAMKAMPRKKNVQGTVELWSQEEVPCENVQGLWNCDHRRRFPAKTYRDCGTVITGGGSLAKTYRDWGTVDHRRRFPAKTTTGTGGTVITGGGSLRKRTGTGELWSQEEVPCENVQGLGNCDHRRRFPAKTLQGPGELWSQEEVPCENVQGLGNCDHEEEVPCEKRYRDWGTVITGGGSLRKRTGTVGTVITGGSLRKGLQTRIIIGSTYSLRRVKVYSEHISRIYTITVINVNQHNLFHIFKVRKCSWKQCICIVSFSRQLVS